ncbi:unnamed protein product [Kuraishia capsulata CBS 1993]|uniref:Uncharacterized protein n=1 Tax=Kuraishia capsulata CBS 1993 TaxID=1382522 RepID=W6MSP9_9ASCO|nr:uncharacterized protein KUCA_T00005727001 [Kuraishia capsulata CBS 1993]CDK29734.1 unnamed protein product [Kuraishia capsulata CBS 1993]
MPNEKKPLLDASGAEPIAEDATATAILRRKKKDNDYEPNCVDLSKVGFLFCALASVSYMVTPDY